MALERAPASGRPDAPGESRAARTPDSALIHVKAARVARLRRSGPIAIIRAMFLSRAARRLISAFAVLSLLACYALGAAHGRDLSVAAAADWSGGGQCHVHTGTGDSDTDLAVPTPCDTAKAPSDAFKLPVTTIAVIATSALLVSATPQHAPTHAPLALYEFPGTPPPLRVLQCCFLN